jgi:hypothetical protein
LPICSDLLTSPRTGLTLDHTTRATRPSAALPNLAHEALDGWRHLAAD